MLDDAAVEKRLIALEQEVANLKIQLSAEKSSDNWLEKVSKIITDKEVLLKVTEYGKAIRDADMLEDDPVKQP